MEHELVSTVIFDKWFKGLKDRSVRNRILARLARIEKAALLLIEWREA